MKEYKLSVVFCAVDETYSLYDAYSKISQYNKACEYLFVLSKNSSLECIETVKDICKKKNCRYFIQSGYGLGNAIRDAIKSAIGTHMIIWPADDGMETAAFPRMVHLSQANPKKIIKVSRWIEKGGFEGYGEIRKIINFISQKMFAFLYKSNLTDFTNPTQIAPVNVYRSIRWQGTSWDLIPELTFKPLKLGYEFIEVFCRNLKRKEGKSKSDFFKLAQYYFIILKIYNMTDADITEGINQ